MPNIDISIRRKRPVSISRGSKKGPIDIPREADYLKRRLQPSGGLKFYDLGRKWDGAAFADITFNFADPYVQLSSGILQGPFVPLNVSVYNDLKDYIFDYDLADIETKHPLMNSVDDGDYFRFSLQTAAAGPITATSEFDPNFKLTGWEVDAALFTTDTFRLRLPGNDFFFNNLWLKGSGAHKITGTPVYSDPAVAYTPGNKDKFFLMPNLARPTGAGHKDSSYPIIRDNIVGDWIPVPRVPIVDFTVFGARVYRQFMDAHYFHDSDPTNTEDMYAFFLAYGVNITRQRSSYPFGGPAVWTSEDPTAFPDPLVDAAWSMYWNGTASDSSNPSSGTLPVGMLLAVIKQGTNLYFVWRNAL